MTEKTTQVEFYVLQAAEQPEMERFICRLAEKVLNLEQTLFILGNPDQCQRLDELLWTFRAESFIPHQRIDDETAVSAPRIPVLLGSSTAGLPPRDALINLSGLALDLPLPTPRVIELVLNQPEARHESRARFRHYRNQGIEPTTVQIDARF